MVHVHRAGCGLRAALASSFEARVLRPFVAALVVVALGLALAPQALAGCGGEPPAPPRPGVTPGTPTSPPVGPTTPNTPRETEYERRVGDRRADRTGRRLPNLPGTLGWWTWWTSHREAWLEPHAVRHAAVVTGAKPEAGEVVGGDASAALEIRTALVPALRALTSPPQRVPTMIRLQALEALGRVDASPFTLRRLALWLGDRRAGSAERTAALRGLGNLAVAEDLDDTLRADLLRVLDRTETNKHFNRQHHTLVSLVLGYLARPERTTPRPVDLDLARFTWDRFDATKLTASDKLALILSLGRQHPRTVASGVRDALTQIVIRGRYKRHGFDAVARAEAVRALIALDEAGAPKLLARVLDSQRLPVELQRAALDELADHVGTATAETRATYARLLVAVQRRVKDPQARGLWYLAAGSLKRVDPTEESDELIRLVLKAARRASADERTFVLLALGLARHDVADVAWQAEAQRQLVDARHDGNPNVRAAAVLALGLRPSLAPAATLRELALSKREDPLVRTAAMETLALQGAPSPEFRSALIRLLDKKQDPRLTASATRTLALIAPRQALKEIREVLIKDGNPTHEADRLFRLADVRVLDFLRPFEAWAKDLREQPLRRIVSIHLLTELGGERSPWRDLDERTQITPGLGLLSQIR